MPTGSRAKNRQRKPRLPLGRSRSTGAATFKTEAADEPIDEIGPQRRCIVSGTTSDREALLRFVVGPDGTIVPDIEARLPGRGLWLTPRRDIVDRAVAKRAFARAARRPVTIPPELGDQVTSLLRRRCLDDLGLARRAGVTVAGYDRVAEAIRRGDVALLLAALDAGENGRGKLAALGRDIPLASVLTAEELGTAFGRERIVHVGIGAGPLCQRLTRDLRRLTGFRPDAAWERETGSSPARPAAAQDGGTEAHG